MKSKVAVVKCDDYSTETVQEAVRRAVDLLGGFESFVSSGQRVFVKPNLLSSRHPDKAVTTHPSVVEAVVGELLDSGAEVRVGDSPPLKGETAEAYKRLCDTTGMTEVCERLGVDLVRLEESVVEVKAEKGKLYRKFEVSREILDASCWVSVPKLKTHELTTLSGAVKNIFGVIPGRRKALFHAQSCTDTEHFCEMLVDLFSAVPPKLTVMDAIIAMEGEGPNAGTPRQVGAIIAGTDPAAVDAVCCSLTGIEPMSVATTCIAHERGLGCGKLEDIEITGDCLEDLAVKDFELPAGKDVWTRMHPLLRRFARKQLVPFPYINSCCKNCRDCVQICPVSAISDGPKRPSIDLDPCIRCYCCHEVCRHNGIGLRQGWLGKLLGKK